MAELDGEQQSDVALVLLPQTVRQVVAPRLPPAYITARTGQVYRSSISNRTHRVRDKAIVNSCRITNHLVYLRCSGIHSDLLPCHLQSSRLKDLHQHFSYFHLAFSVIPLNTEGCRTSGASWPGPDNLFDPGAFALEYRLAIRLSLLDFWSFPVTVLYRLLCAITATFRPRLPLS